MTFRASERQPSQNYRKVTALAIVVRQSKVLLVRQAQAQPWELPWAHVQNRETAIDAASNALLTFAGLTKCSFKFVGYHDAIFHDDILLGFSVCAPKKIVPVRQEGVSAIDWFSAKDPPLIAVGHQAMINQFLALR